MSRLESNLVRITMVSSQDMSDPSFASAVSATAGLHRFVSAHSVEGQTIRTVAGGSMLGVADMAAVAGGVLPVKISGVSKIVLGGAGITPGTRLASSIHGTAVAAGAGDYVAGVCLQGGGVGDIGTIALTGVYQQN